MERPSLNEIQEFLRNKGKKGEMAITLLSKLEPFMQSIQTEVGWELLRDDIARYEELLIKMESETATQQELAEFRYLKARVIKVTERINRYINSLKEIKNG
mgnify:CR=1 FL=1